MNPSTSSALVTQLLLPPSPLDTSAMLRAHAPSVAMNSAWQQWLPTSMSFVAVEKEEQRRRAFPKKYAFEKTVGKVKGKYYVLKYYCTGGQEFMMSKVCCF